MKKIGLISFILLCGVFTSAFSQGKAKDLVGIWQLCNNGETVSGTTNLQAANIWKVIGKDGRFCQFWTSDVNNLCTIMHEGTYKVKKGQTYIEHVKSHAFDEGIVNTKTEIHYRFLNENQMVFTFKLANSNQQYQELWTRVRMVKK